MHSYTAWVCRICVRGCNNRCRRRCIGHGNLRSMRSEDSKVWSRFVIFTENQQTWRYSKVWMKHCVFHPDCPLTNMPFYCIVALSAVSLSNLQEQVSRCQATADSLSTCSTRCRVRHRNCMDDLIWMQFQSRDGCNVGNIPTLSLMGHVFFFFRQCSNLRA